MRSRLRAFWTRSLASFASNRRDDEAIDEMADHLEHDIARYIASGLSPQEARRRALANSGGLQNARERYRDQTTFPFLAVLWQDVRSGLRLLRRNPGFSGVTIGVIALGIGVNTAMFTVINAVLLQPLRLPDPDRVVLLSYAPKDWSFTNPGMLEQAYLNVREGDDLLDGLAAFDHRMATVNVAGEAIPVSVASVTTEFFSVLRVVPALGRTLMPDDDDPTHDNVVVLSNHLWRTHLAGRPDAIDTRVTIDGVSRRVIGVMATDLPPSFEADAWVPMTIRPASDYSQGRTVIGRLKPTTSIEQLQDEIESLAGPSVEQFGEDPSHWSATVVRLKDSLVGDVRLPLIVLSCAVGLVLLIACSNVASLFLARTEQRSRELAVRAALGAGRGRIVRQLLTESLVISLTGGLIGLFVTFAALRSITALAMAGHLPLINTIRVDATVFLFACGLSVMAGVLFGMAPAFGTRRTLSAIVAPGRTTTFRHDRLHGALIVAEVALSLVLLAGAGLLAKSLFQLRAVDPGFATSQIAAIRVNLPAANNRSADDLRAFQDAVLTKLSAVPTVTRTAAVNLTPLGGAVFATTFTLPDGLEWPPAEMAHAMYVTDGYFETMNIRLRQGRTFGRDDRLGAPRVVLVSASFANRFWPAGNAVGQRISDRDKPTAADWLTIVGIVDDVRQTVPQERQTLAVYRLFSQATEASITHQPSLATQVTFVARTTSAPHDIAPAVRAIFREVDPTLPVPAVVSITDLIGERTVAERFQTTLLTTFGVTALVLTIVGIYGVLAYSVSQRTREIGIRMALGADRRRLVVSVVRRSVVLTMVGIGVGAAGALMLTDVLQALLFEVSPTDPPTFVAVALLLFMAAIGAAMAPAIRASRVDPVTALRAE